MLLLAAPAALADDEDAYGMGWGCGMGQGGHMRFAAIDQNGDGSIGDDEAAANAEAVFVVMDADDSGDLTEEEFVETHMGWAQGWHHGRREAMEGRKRERFTAMDTDGDKLVSQVEFLAAAKEHFAGADTDKDGKVGAWEFRSHRRMF
jgi:hypothetical protein